jgi:hypothetical protein
MQISTFTQAHSTKLSPAGHEVIAHFEHWLEAQCSPAAHVPHSSVPPHPSARVPQKSAPHVSGTQQLATVTLLGGSHEVPPESVEHAFTDCAEPTAPWMS